MPLNKYRVFSKIAETGSMRKAADEMMYTQQAVSRIVKCMEEEYGFALFVRERDGVRLTSNAEKLLPSIKTLISEEDKLDRIITDIQAGEGLIKKVQIGACGSIVMNLVNRTLHKLQSDYHEMSVAVHYNANNKATLSELRKGNIDFAIMVEGCQEEMNFEELFREEFYAVLPQGHPLADKDSISTSDLINYPNVVVADNPSFEEIISNTDHHTIVVDEEIMMPEIISQGTYIGIMSGVVQFNIDEHLLIKPLEEKHYRILGVVTRPGETPNDTVAKLIDIFKEAAKAE